MHHPALIPAVLRRPQAAPEQFEALTGLTPAAFEALVQKAAPLYRQSEALRLGGRLRQRSLGAGRKFEHPLAERLAVQLVLRHARPTQKLLSRITGFTESTLSRDARRLAAVLPPVSPPTQLQSTHSPSTQLQSAHSSSTQPSALSSLPACPAPLRRSVRELLSLLSRPTPPEVV